MSARSELFSRIFIGSTTFNVAVCDFSCLLLSANSFIRSVTDAVSNMLKTRHPCS